MCGIAGIIGFNRNSDVEKRIKLMSDRMRHRGPDSDGFFVEKDNYIALGHRRLSIIDLSHLGCQPLEDESGRYVLVFNGEIYNYKEVRSRLDDYHFKSNSDSEVLLAAFSKWGIDCVNLFKGMFAFAVWDRRDRMFFIVRDRLGVKPVYYFQNDNYFVFASELRSILASGLVQRSLDYGGLFEYLSFQSVGGPGSIVKDVVQLEPGCYIKIQNGIIQKSSYWDITKIKPAFEYCDASSIKSKVYSLLQDSVKRRMVSDVPVGAFLSGGIDSSAIVALMSQLDIGRPNTFTASFEEVAFDETPFADMIAKKFNTNHTNVKLKPGDFLGEIESALNSMDSPSGDGVNTYVISRAIKRAGISVALSGLGGDELFVGYPTFSYWARLARYKKVWPFLYPFRRIASSLLSISNSGKGQRLKELLDQSSLDISCVYPALRRMLSPKQLSHILNDVVPSMAGFEKKILRDSKSLTNFPLLSQMSIAELNGYTLNTLLKDTDQMSMAVSLEIREPFFDHDLVEFVLKIPDKFKASGYPKRLLVESLGSLLPGDVVYRRKQGFVFPWEMWLRRELRDFGTKYVVNMCDRPFINGSQLFRMWNTFLSGNKSVRWADMWLFIVLEFWLETNQIDE